MPIDIKMLATTISIMINGKYKITPILKATVNSCKMYDGIKTWVGTSARVFGFSSTPDILIKSARELVSPFI